MMRIYTIHLPPRFGPADADPVTVKEGFNWAAAIFMVLWALWHRMWLVAIGLLVVSAAIGAGAAFLGLGPESRAALTIGYAVLVGFHANDWRRRALGRKDFEDAGIVAAPRADAALRRFGDLRSMEGGAYGPLVRPDGGP